VQLNSGVLAGFFGMCAQVASPTRGHRGFLLGSRDGMPADALG